MFDHLGERHHLRVAESVQVDRRQHGLHHPRGVFEDPEFVTERTRVSMLNPGKLRRIPPHGLPHARATPRLTGMSAPRPMSTSAARPAGVGTGLRVAQPAGLNAWLGVGGAA
nr:hypothetical protein BJQ95_02203 [Cryobacterium sp. SO1]